MFESKIRSLRCGRCDTCRDMYVIEHREILICIINVIEGNYLKRTVSDTVLLIILELFNELWKIKSSGDDVYLD